MATVDTPAISPSQHSHIHIPFNHTVKLVLLALVISFAGGFIGYFVSQQQQKQETQMATVIGTATVEVEADTVYLTAVNDTRGIGYAKTTADGKKKLDELKQALISAGLPEKKFTVTSSYTTEDYEANDTKGPIPSPAFICSGSELCSTGGSGDGAGIGRVNTKTQQKIAATLAATDSIAKDDSQKYISTSNVEVTLDGKLIAEEEKFYEILSKYDYTSTPNRSYSLKNKEAAYAKVQEMAVLNARKQAENVAKINKAHVKRVLSIKGDKKIDESDYYYDPADISTTKTITLTESYEVRYQLESNFLSF